jgi:uncharacterized protein
MSTPSATQPRSAVVVRGGWDGHFPVETTELFIPFLETSGFAVRVEESATVFADAAFMETVDLIVLTASMATIDDAQFAGLRTAVERGAGMAGWHGGIVDAYRDRPDYLQFMGAQFAAHPGKPEAERMGVPSDSFVTHSIRMTEAGKVHPITTGLADFELDTEQYWLLHDDYLDVLATTTVAARDWEPWNRPITSPAIWTRQWGLGRIFVATPGHDVSVLENHTVRAIVERGMLWAARDSAARDSAARDSAEETR